MKKVRGPIRRNEASVGRGENCLLGVRAGGLFGLFSRLAVVVGMLALVGGVLAERVSVDTRYTVRALRVWVDELPVVELPSKAGKLVEAVEDEKLRQRVAIRIARVFLSVRPSLAPSLVGNIVKAAPDTAIALTAEVVQLFPEQAYAIVRAAVAAAPDHAGGIALQVALQTPEAVGPAVSVVRADRPELIPSLVAFVEGITSGREESVQLAVFTTKNRIGTSTETSPADLSDATLNNPEGQTQLRFREDSLEIPEDLSGSEIVSRFDTIFRQLLNSDDNEFAREIVIEDYIR